MHRLEVGELWVVASLNQCLPRALHELRGAAAEHRLLTEEIALSLILERGLHDAGARAAESVGVRHDASTCGAGCLLPNGEECRHAAARNVDGSHEVAWPLRRNHPHVRPLGRLDATEMNIESVGKQEQRTLLQVASDLGVVERLLRRVGRGNHHDVGALRCLSGGENLKAVSGGNGAALRTLLETDDHGEP